jgi:hypothetical protein
MVFLFFQIFLFCDSSGFLIIKSCGIFSKVGNTNVGRSGDSSEVLRLTGNIGVRAWKGALKT